MKRNCRHTSHMRPGTVLHQEEPMTHCISIMSENHSEVFILVPYSSEGAADYDMEVCVTLQRYASPDHRWPTDNLVMLDDVTGNMVTIILPGSSLSHVLSVNLLSSVKRTGAGGRPADSGDLWPMPVKLLGAGLWAQVPLEDVGPSCHPHGVCFRQFGLKHVHQ